jgi:hypothetical protein
MERAITTLLFVLIVAVLGVGFVVWQSDQHADERHAETTCLQRIDALASVAALVPEGRIDEAGRLEAVEELGNDADAC